MFYASCFMIIFLYGEDDYRSLAKLKEIEKKFLEKNSSSLASGSFDFEENKELNLSQLKSAFGSKGLFSAKQLIIIKSLLANGSKELLKDTLSFLKSEKDLDKDNDTVVLFWEKGKTNEKGELFKYLLAKSKKQKFETLAGAKLNQWVSSEIKKIDEKISISNKALEKLVGYTGGDLRVLSNEILKLCNYKDKGVICEEDVEMLAKEKISSSIFETIEALSSGNKKLALKLFHEQIQKGEDPLYILMMYVYQFRNFLKVGDCYWSGIRYQNEIAQKTGVHPFVAGKILKQISNFPMDKLKKIYLRLQEIDEKAKTGKGDAKIELDRFIVEI